jgi:hypothetical protein
LSSCINTYTTNWFKVTDLSTLEDYVERCTFECLNSGDNLTIHHHNGAIRLTAFDVIDQGFGLYDEDEDEFIDLSDIISEMLEEGEVFRLTTVVWFKGRLDHMSISVHTWDGRSASRGNTQILKELSEDLEINVKSLDGWN